MFTPVVPSAVPQLILSYLTPEKIGAAASAFESCFYASLKICKLDAPGWKKSIHEGAISYVNEIQLLFNIVNASSLIYIGAKLYEEAKKNHAYSLLKALPPSLAHASFVLTATFTVAVATAILDRYLLKTTPSINEDGLTITEEFSLQQATTRFFHVVKLVMTAALACFSENPTWALLTATGTVYSFSKNLQLKWQLFTKTFTYPRPLDEPRITRATVTYHMLTLPAPKTDETCPICLELQPNTAFCAYHLIHKTCLTQTINQKSDYFLDSSQVVRHDTRHYVNNNYTHTSHDYSVKLSEESLPQCPLCRTSPLENHCEVVVEDADFGRFYAITSIARPSSTKQLLYENLYTAYNFFQAVLSYLQKYPEFKAPIFKIQIGMLLTDLIGWGSTLYFFYKNLKEKMEFSTKSAYLVTSIGTLATMIFSYLAVKKLHRIIRPILILNDVLKSLNISSQELKGMDMSWAPLEIQEMIECVYVCRLVSSLALSYFASNRKKHLFNIFLQASSLFNVSQLTWIKLTQVLENPLTKIAATGGKLSRSLNEYSLKTLTITYNFLIDSHCTKSSEHLQSAVNAIYNYATTLLYKSTWDRYWIVTKRNGIEVGRKLTYSAILNSKAITACACNLFPSLVELSMKGVDATYGSTTIRVTQS